MKCEVRSPKSEVRSKPLSPSRINGCPTCSFSPTLTNLKPRPTRPPEARPSQFQVPDSDFELQASNFVLARTSHPLLSRRRLPRLGADRAGAGRAGHGYREVRLRRGHRHPRGAADGRRDRRGERTRRDAADPDRGRYRRGLAAPPQPRSSRGGPIHLALPVGRTGGGHRGHGPAEALSGGAHSFGALLSGTVGGVCLALVALQVYRVAGGRVPRIPPGRRTGMAVGGVAGFVSRPSRTPRGRSCRSTCWTSG